MGVTYAQIEEYINNKTGDEQAVQKIKRYHETRHHKRSMPLMYGEE